MKSSTVTLISLIVAGTLIGWAFLSTQSASSWDPNIGPSENVNEVNGVQYIDISAKGGYSPRLTYAKSGIPTILRIETRNTFDCSTSLVMPSLNYRKILSPSGIEEIELPPQKAGTSQKGLCSMGMYGFEVRFN